MNSDVFEARMRSLEYFHRAEYPLGAWPILRIDGRGFSKLTQRAEFEKPYDMRFRDLMIGACEALFIQLGALFVYTESDDISVLLPRDSGLFGREVEKITTVSAGLATAAFCAGAVKIGMDISEQLPHFDSRAILGTNASIVCDYFRWRQADAARCGLNGWCYWTLREAGSSDREATSILDHAREDFKHDLLHKTGRNYNNVPMWQKRGIGLYHKTVDRTGRNPLTGETTQTQRRDLVVDLELTMKDDYSAFLTDLIAAHLDRERTKVK